MKKISTWRVCAFVVLMLMAVAFGCKNVSSSSDYKPSGGPPTIKDYDFSEIFTKYDGGATSSLQAPTCSAENPQKCDNTPEFFMCRTSDGQKWSSSDDSVICVVNGVAIVVPQKAEKTVTLSDGAANEHKFEFVVKAGNTCTEQTQKTDSANSNDKFKIAFFGNGVYNEVTEGSPYSNKNKDAGAPQIATGDGNVDSRGFLGHAFYAKNWVATDKYAFKDFAVTGAVLNPQSANSVFKNGSAAQKQLAEVIAWQPDFLILNFGNEENLSAADFAKAYEALARTIKVKIPETHSASVQRDGYNVTTNNTISKEIYLATPIVRPADDKSKMQGYAAEVKKIADKTYNEFACIDLTSVSLNAKYLYGRLAGRSANAVGEALLFGFFADAELAAFPMKVDPDSETVPPECKAECGTQRGTDWSTSKTNFDTNTRNGDSSIQPDFIFVGDSITHWWWAGGSYKMGTNWETLWGDYKTINLGQASDTTADVLHRINDKKMLGEVGTYKPKVVFVMIGTNNFGNGNNTNNFGGVSNAYETAFGVLEVAKTVHKYCPTSKIVLTLTLPTRLSYDMTRAKIEAANRIVRDLMKDWAENENVQYSIVDMEEELTDEDGLCDVTCYKETAAQVLHLVDKGYEKWAPRLLAEVPGSPKVKLVPSSNVLTGGVTISVLDKKVAVSSLSCTISDGDFNAKIVNGKIVVTPKNSGASVEKPNVKIAVKQNGSEIASCTVTIPQVADDSYRKYTVDGKDYNFSLVKMFHFDSTASAKTTDSNPVRLTTVGSGDPNKCGLLTSSGTGSDTTVKMNEGGEHYLTCLAQSNPGVGVAFMNGTGFEKGSYDYVEIRFRSASNAASKIGL